MTPEDAADDIDDGAETAPDRVAAAAHRRPRDRLPDRQLLPDSFRDQELLCPLEHPGQRAPQLLGLVHERGHDQNPIADRAYR